MSNLTTIPAIDWFETTLAQSWNGAVGTVYVDSIPASTFPSGEKTYIVVNPWKTNMQVARVSAWTTWQFTVDSISTFKGSTSLAYTQQSHAVKSKVMISDNYQFWLDIQTAINSKIDDDVDTTWAAATTFAGMVVKSLTTTQRNALTASNWSIIYNTTTGEFNIYQWGAWSVVSSWSTQPNASTTVAGKVEEGTQTEVEQLATTGGTGALVFVTPTTINPSSITSATIATWDKISFADASDSNYLKSGTIQSLLSLWMKFWWTGADGAVDGTANVTVTWSNNTYIVKNYSSWSAWTATRTLTITPTNCVLHIKVSWNCDLTDWTLSFAGKWAPWWTLWVASTGTASSTLLQAHSNGWWASWSWGWSQWWWWWWAWNGGNGWTGANAWGTGGAWWVAWAAVALTWIQWKRSIELSTGAAWWTLASTGWVWWAWWWCLIIEVAWNLTLNNSTTVINMNGSNWTAATGAISWWWWWWWWCVYIMYNGTLTWTCTPTVAWWTGWAGAWGWAAWANGWAWLSLIEQNVVFS